MIVLMKCLNEEKSAKRCISDFYDEKFCEKIIVIDGGSSDYTVQEIKEIDKENKISVFIHPWLDWYHNMEVCQSNIALSYVPIGELCVIIDFDERFNDKLKETLNIINNEKKVEGLGNVARKTSELVRYPNSTFCVFGDDNWPLISHQIGQFPDYQPRIIRRALAMHWINSPHHQLYGYESQYNLNDDCYFIHYEKEDSRDRIAIEKKWLKAQARRKMLGLEADVFECKPKPEILEYSDPDKWYWEG